MTLRKGVWGGGNASSRDVGEALRDHDQTLRDIPTTTTVEAVFTYAPPFYLRAKKRPKTVTLDRTQPYKEPGLVATGMVSWTWKGSEGVRIDAIEGLSVGDRYQMTFRLVS
jgi:hypothetical protein